MSRLGPTFTPDRPAVPLIGIDDADRMLALVRSAQHGPALTDGARERLRELQAAIAALLTPQAPPWPECFASIPESRRTPVAVAVLIASKFPQGNSLSGPGPIQSAINRLAARGGIDWTEAAEKLLGRVEAFAASKIAKTTPRAWMVSLSRWCEEEQYYTDPKSWDVNYASGKEDKARYTR